jgi:hypothetical protein
MSSWIDAAASQGRHSVARVETHVGRRFTMDDASRDGGYSARKASTGFTDAARRAGM